LNNIRHTYYLAAMVISHDHYPVVMASSAGKTANIFFQIDFLIQKPQYQVKGQNCSTAKTIQRILRHKDLSTAERYIKKINEDPGATVNLL